LWVIPTVDKVPRNQRFLLEDRGDRIQSTGLDVVEALIEATYTSQPLSILRRVSFRSLDGRSLPRCE
jgi:hypothetical protein